MDGVLYRHTEAISSAIKVVNDLKRMGKKIAYLTNNSTKTPQEYVEKLSTMGLEARPEEVYTSSTISANLLEKSNPGPLVYVIGMYGLKDALKKKGFTLLNEERPDLEEHPLLPDGVRADMVVMGWDTKLTFAKMRTGMMLILDGAEFYATNDDYNFPVPGTLWPGTGAQIAYLSRALGKPPKKIFGKPQPDGIYSILKNLNLQKEEAVMIGDRFNTDILAGNNAGVTTICVETGINTSKDIEKTPVAHHPDHIFPTLKDWFEEYFS